MLLQTDLQHVNLKTIKQYKLEINDVKIEVLSQGSQNHMADIILQNLLFILPLITRNYKHEETVPGSS